MRTAVKIIIVIALYLPYRMAFMDEDTSFWINFLVIFIAFLVGEGVAYLIFGKPNIKGNEENDDEVT